MKILVTYTNLTGSIAEVAGKVGETLNRLGENAVVKPMNEVTDVRDYNAVVVGSVVMFYSWMPEAIEFLHRHRKILSKKPFAIFTVSMGMEIKDEGWHRASVMEWTAPVRSLVRPYSEGLFAGNLDITRMPKPGDRLKFKLSALFGVSKDSEHRKWYEIEKWAAGLPCLFT